MSVDFGRMQAVFLAAVEHHAPGQWDAYLDEALGRLAQHDPAAGQLVKLCYFAGLSVEQAAEALALSRSNAYRLWTFARAWLWERLQGGGPDDDTV